MKNVSKADMKRFLKVIEDGARCDVDGEFQNAWDEFEEAFYKEMEDWEKINVRDALDEFHAQFGRLPTKDETRAIRISIQVGQALALSNFIGKYETRSYVGQGAFRVLMRRK